MNKAELLKALSATTDLPIKKIDEVLTHLADAVEGQLNTTGEITLPGIGKLRSELREARTGRNPKTGEAVEIAAKSVVKFSVAKALKDAVA